MITELEILRFFVYMLGAGNLIGIIMVLLLEFFN
jgi:hypothetical protein